MAKKKTTKKRGGKKKAKKKSSSRKTIKKKPSRKGTGRKEPTYYRMDERGHKYGSKKDWNRHVSYNYFKYKLFFSILEAVLFALVIVYAYSIRDIILQDLWLLLLAVLTLLVLMWLVSWQMREWWGKYDEDDDVANPNAGKKRGR